MGGTGRASPTGRLGRIALAMAFARGWIGRSEPSSDDAAHVEDDPAYNPYARED